MITRQRIANLASLSPATEATTPDQGVMTRTVTGWCGTMLNVEPKGWFSQTFTVRDGDMQVASIDLAAFGEQAEIAIEGRPYTLRRERFASGPFLLESNGVVLARADKPQVLARLFVVENQGRPLTLKHAGGIGRKFVLLAGEQGIGSMGPQRMGGRAAVANFPSDLPLPTRVFMIWLVLILWRRAAGAAAAAGGASG